MINNKLSSTKQFGSINEAFWERRLCEWLRRENRWQIISALHFLLVKQV